MGNEHVIFSMSNSTYLEDPSPSDAMTNPLPTFLTRMHERLRRRLGHIVGPETVNRPKGSTVMWSVLGFLLLLTFECLAVAYPRRPMLITSGIVAFTTFTSLVVLTILDLRPNGILYQSLVTQGSY